MKETRHIKVHTLCFHFYETLEKTNLMSGDQEEISVARDVGIDCRGAREFSGAKEMFFILIKGVLTWVHTFVKTH